MTDLTPQQRENLTVLAAYLRTLPADYPDFAMTVYSKDGRGSGGDDAHLPECGTAACAVGHGPGAGILPLPGENWASYSYRVFIDDYWAWQWCFSGTWSRVDNTAHGAAKRIEWLLAKGLPDDAAAQRFGHSPLCYTAALSLTIDGGRNG